MEIEIKETRDIPKDQLLDLYILNKWSSAEKPGSQLVADQAPLPLNNPG